MPSTTTTIPAAIASGATPRRRLKVLLVDDHQPTRIVLCQLLDRRGMSVQVADSMGEALAIAAAATFDLVISDIGLPDGDGCKLMSLLRDRYHLKGIAMTGHGTRENIFRGHEAGFCVYLIKPFTINALEAAIAAAMPP